MPPSVEIPPRLLQDLRSAQNVAALTGAGVSQESGLRTFRDPMDGLWAQYRPEDLATLDAFERDPELVWEFYAMRRLKGGQVQPNPGHYALAEIGRRIPYFSLITQNVDGLHQRAGSSDVIELHGNITRLRCSRDCGPVTEWKDDPKKIPRCPRCGANLRPDVVWFGEMLPEIELERAIEAARASRVFLSIGTSAVVHPAATLPILAKESGACLVEINPEKTPLTASADYFLQGKSGEILPELVRQIWR
ncbi:MAG TPA: NAD-dependent deacylase [Anaerolineales bacterium]|nr:NAD-dependent deacylase [Anaerolineales bacterium]